MKYFWKITILLCLVKLSNSITNPPLKLNIESTGLSTWEITSSCSNPLPVITCMNNASKIPLENIVESKCQSTQLSTIKATVRPNPPSLLIKCHAVRGTEKIDEFGQVKFHIEVEDLPTCIYRLSTSCTIYKLSFKCVNGDNPMHFKEETHPCSNKFMKMYHVELKSLIYGSTFNCSTVHENKIYSIQKTISCHVPFYTSGGVLISMGILLAGVAVTIYLLKIGPAKNATTWKFGMWYIGILFVDIGVLLFLYTLSWEIANTVFLPFLLLLTIKDIFVLLIGLYVKKNGGFFFMNTSKVCNETVLSPKLNHF